MNLTVVMLLLFGTYVVLAEAWVAVMSAPLPYPGSLHYILVLGANGNIESPVVIDRANSAYLASQQFPEARILLTGKPDEVVAYKTLLTVRGLSQFIEEPMSTTTWDNVRLSEKLMDPSKNILVVTSEYHQPRALAMARSLKWNAWVFGKDGRQYQMKWYFFLKERFSNGKYFLPMVFSWLSR